MLTICPTHNHTILSACLQKNCKQHFLCCKCIRQHPEDHDTFFRAVPELQDNLEWIESCENSRNELLTQIEACQPLKDQLVSQYKHYIENVIDKLLEMLEKQKKTLLQELGNLDQEEKLFSRLNEGVESLKRLDFRSGDVNEKVIRVKAFNEEIGVKTRDLLGLVDEKAKRLLITQEKLGGCKEELSKVMEMVHLETTGVRDGSYGKKILELEEENKNLKQHNGLNEETVAKLQEIIDSLNNERSVQKTMVEEANKAKMDLEAKLKGSVELIASFKQQVKVFQDAENVRVQKVKQLEKEKTELTGMQKDATDQNEVKSLIESKNQEIQRLNDPKNKGTNPYNKSEVNSFIEKLVNSLKTVGIDKKA